ncbi:DUF6310 domain-containing protein [Pyxidicoccus trucidator]|uniref:DUF6310 domain-containing protein n=1 Tax=Pyxidicoccus trucidator TaxID=2709662 RepID=UPI0013DD2026|nr:DUF6310 domain-containing protein [Pyxidicoccus trucidator]
MRFRSCIALLLLLSACATTEPRPGEPVARSPSMANLQRAAALPWRDEGRCVVQEASHPWPVLVERCFHTLDTRKVRFHDPERRCTVASAGAVAVPAMVGICLLSQPYILVGAVVIIGAVVVAVAIHEELEAYELRRPYSEDAEPVPHLGGDALHNQCADRVPLNGFPGSDVLVNGKRFDALQPRARVLWEVKTDNFDTYSPDLRDIVLRKQIAELQREARLARECGYHFSIGVRSASHGAALERLDPTLEIVVMDWC